MPLFIKLKIFFVQVKQSNAGSAREVPGTFEWMGYFTVPRTKVIKNSQACASISWRGWLDKLLMALQLRHIATRKVTTLL